MRIRLILLRKAMLSSETLLTLPKPLVHLFYHQVNTGFTGSTRRHETGLHCFKAGALVYPVTVHTQSN